MKQSSAQKFVSEDGKISVVCDSDTSLGNLHDNLLSLKGQIVERMVQLQKEEDEKTKAQKELDKKSDEAEKKE